LMFTCLSFLSLVIHKILKTLWTRKRLKCIWQNSSAVTLFFLSLFHFLLYYCSTEDTVWHLQKCSQYILHSPPALFSFTSISPAQCNNCKN
jgi:hypothetical protein